MENNNFPFNPCRYEKHLSVFGRKVLNVLAQKWKSDQNGIQRLKHGYYQHGGCSKQDSKVLTFRGNESPLPSLPAPPMICEQINNKNQHGDFSSATADVSHHSNVNILHHNTIPTTLQLVQAVGAPINGAVNVDHEISSSDLINPVIEGRIPNDPYEKQNIDFNLGKVPANTNNVDCGNNGIDWDNMFDSELFSTDTTTANAQLVLRQIEFPDPNTFEIQFPRETAQKETKSKEKSHKPEKEIETKKSKYKNETITDAIPKKVKKVSVESKQSFRKQKYTKAVKNWLNNVDPNNPVHEKDGDVELNEPRMQTEIVIEKFKQKSNKKKVVQAQLANKDGIMKFGKPKTKSIKNHETEQENVSSEKNSPVHDQHASKENKSVKNIRKEQISKENKTDKAPGKDKKAKSKFVAPIKSQIPVKEVEFQITAVNAANIGNIRDTLKSIEDQDMVAVLIYRNGFCQLNNQHTEDKCDPDGFLLSIGEDFFLFKEDQQSNDELAQTLLKKNNIICYDGKSLLMYFKSKLDLDTYEIKIIDAEIGGSLLEPDNPPADFTELQKQISYTPQYTIATECVLQKTAWYATQLGECSAKLVGLLQDQQLWNVFVNIEMKLLPIIAEMESLGVTVDLQKLKTMEHILLTKMKATELECHKAAGRSFQINSPAQVRALIYDELKLDAKCNLKIRETLAQGAKSTSEAMLRGLVSVHPLPRLILQYRHLHKAHATFLAGIALHVKDGVVKPTWVQTAAATGRIASNNPNLQAIPKAPFNLVLFPEHDPSEHVGESEGGAGGADEEALWFRSVYRARRGCSLLACDFKQVECRVFAHLARDHELQAALRGRGDLFRLLAHKWLQKPESEVSGGERERTKRIVYAALYGAGVRTLMDILGVRYEQALAVNASFNRWFPSLKSFGASVVRECAARGGRLATLGGRVRAFPDIASDESVRRAHAQRQALNFVIQGSAADVCKVAMVRASARLRAHAPPLRARLLLQIHDELVWEVPDEHLPAAAGIIKLAMEESGMQSGMRDPLPVAISVGRDWAHMTPYLTP